MAKIEIGVRAGKSLARVYRHIDAAVAGELGATADPFEDPHVLSTTLLWDILCPVCRVASQVQETLKAIREHGSCAACRTDFPLDFANSIELVFRMAADLRAVDTGTYCIGGPSHSPHVAAQMRLASGERFELALALRDGEYRLRGAQLPYAVVTEAVSSDPQVARYLGRRSSDESSPGERLVVEP